MKVSNWNFRSAVEASRFPLIWWWRVEHIHSKPITGLTRVEWRLIAIDNFWQISTGGQSIWMDFLVSQRLMWRNGSPTSTSPFPPSSSTICIDSGVLSMFARQRVPSSICFRRFSNCLINLTVIFSYSLSRYPSYSLPPHKHQHATNCRLLLLFGNSLMVNANCV